LRYKFPVEGYIDDCELVEDKHECADMILPVGVHVFTDVNVGSIVDANIGDAKEETSD
jgi:hypothetical protein